MKQKFRNFFTDSDGRVVVGQWPNVPLIIWLGSALLNRVIESPGLSSALTFLAFSAGGYWAVLELARGDSPFRRTLGAVVLSVLAYGLVQQLLSL